ncbi:carbamoyltransferase HypF [Actinomadura sp. ATCC 31491]|uniref:Carbamoyltransferase n=1 Tax=Actinomadura luzonensis TaxID=2805427 RepID=A0ABT0FW87_9ACTN|nr:carbamoyltransferase HypF [Actinomadura luzonensis]MCK2216423.1 carbamoyltransferase HypF [Actinomadura luzonensis]
MNTFDQAAAPSGRPGLKRVDVHVEGIVQGVGFRPFVYALARRLDLAGQVRNDVNGVHIEVEGACPRVEEFLTALEHEAPALAEIERVTVVRAEPAGHHGFTIAASDPAGLRRALVPADTATCDDCLRELADPADRRHRYPFINCTNCGPRFTIVRAVPYDRPLTTMAGFPMCAECAAEYHDPGDRRFHAQPTCCPACGPRLRLLDSRGNELCGDPVATAAALLRAGRVLAVKGLGGYHLAVLAAAEPAAAALRGRKHREDKPFAVMAADLAQARRLCVVDDTAAALLTSRARPIVLLPRRDAPPAAAPPTAPPTALPTALPTDLPDAFPDAFPDALPDVLPVAPSVAPGNRSLGILLPYTPLHHLLLAELAEPLVLTSGNVSDEPIAHDDADALARLGGIADAFLTHDRPIHVRADDSVVRPVAGEVTVLRRARGYAPEPLPLRHFVPRTVLACGAELKSTFCLAGDRRAFVSQHIGDLENYETLRSFTDGIDHFCALFDLRPEIVAHDLHPDYLSTKHALEIPGVEHVGVQHHHAHIAACLADNGEPGPVIGVAFDGLGYGTDGTLWGGEFLRADLTGFERLGRLAPVPMPGGAAAVRQPWRMTAAYLGPAETHRKLGVARRNADRWADVLALAAKGVNAPLTSSAGRLFDAVSALLGVRDHITYEGQAAIELEQHADPAETGAYRARLTPGDLLTVHGEDLVHAAARDLEAGRPTPVIAGRFHNGVADTVLRACAALRDATGLTAVALSGGVFQNVLLTERTVRRLREAGFRVLTHLRVPPNDGGISLGQAVVAAARDRAGLSPAL